MEEPSGGHGWTSSKYKKNVLPSVAGTHLNVNRSAGPRTSHETWPARSGARKHRSRRERVDRSGTCPTFAAGELCDGRNASVTISICGDVSQALQYSSSIGAGSDVHPREGIGGDICRLLRGLCDCPFKTDAYSPRRAPPSSAREWRKSRQPFARRLVGGPPTSSPPVVFPQCRQRSHMRPARWSLTHSCRQKLLNTRATKRSRTRMQAPPCIDGDRCA